MKKRPLLAIPLALGLVMLGARPVAAFVSVDPYGPLKVEIMLKQLAEQIRNVAEIGQLISTVEAVLRLQNDALGAIRQINGIYAFFERYSWDDLTKDTRRAFFSTYPDLAVAEAEDFAGSYESAKNDTFFSYRGRSDRRMSRVLHKEFEYQFTTNIWPTAFPEGRDETDEPSPVETYLLKRNERLMERRRRAAQLGALATLKAEADMFRRDAAQKDHAEQRMLAHDALVQVQALKNSTELLALAEQDAALEELAREERRQFAKTLASTLSENAASLVRP